MNENDEKRMSCSCGRSPVWMSNHATWCPAYVLSNEQRQLAFRRSQAVGEVVVHALLLRTPPVLACGIADGKGTTVMESVNCVDCMATHPLLLLTEGIVKNATEEARS